jgi:hypothetical protein
MSYDFAGSNCGVQWTTQHRRTKRPRWGRKKKLTATPSLATVANADFLLDAYDHLRSEGGQAAGPDGLTYDALSRSEAAFFCRKLAAALRRVPTGLDLAAGSSSPRRVGAAAT